LNLTAQDTKNGGTKTVYDSFVTLVTSGVTALFDDLYVKVGAGETFLGDTAIIGEILNRQSTRVAIVTPGDARNARQQLRVAVNSPTEAQLQGYRVSLLSSPSATVELSRYALRVLRPYAGAGETVPTVLLLQEDFDSYSDWTSVLGAVNPGTGRTGAGMKLVSNNAIYYIVPPLLESDTMTVGFAFKPNTTSGNGLLGGNRTNNTATSPLVLCVTTAGALNVRLDSTAGTVILATANGVVTNGTWCYVEMQSKIHDTTGFVTLRVNGVQVGTVTNTDTRAATNKNVFDSWGFNGTSGSTHIVDDFYMIVGPAGTFRGSERYGVDNNVIHEAFDNLAAWSITGGSPSITASGRTGNALDLSAANEQVTLTIPLAQRSYQVVIGFAIYVTSALSTINIVSLYDSTGGLLGLLRLSATGQLSFAGSQGLTAVGVITANTWYYVEWQTMALGPGASQSIIRVNNTQAGFAENFNSGVNAGDVASIVLAGASSSSTYYDDLYVRTGGLSDFEGDQHITPPSTVGKVKGWTGSAYVDEPVRAWSGSAFVDSVAVKTWNGSAFV
jgi:hypothetical protein